MATPRYDLIVLIDELDGRVGKCLADCGGMSAPKLGMGMGMGALTLIAYYLSSYRIAFLASGVEICDVQIRRDAGGVESS